MIKDNYLESSRLLRDTADKMLKDFCAKYGQDFREYRATVLQKIDPGNMKLPVNFYKDYYNYVLENFKL